MATASWAVTVVIVSDLAIIVAVAVYEEVLWRKPALQK
jgi:hypothetical protein